MGTNIVTFCPRLETSRSVRVLPTLVEVDGEPAPGLEVEEISRAPGPRLNRARLRCRCSTARGVMRMEALAKQAEPGRRIVVQMVAQANAVAGEQMVWPLFSGVIAGGKGTLSSREDGLEIEAVDELTWRDGERIEGRRILFPCGGTDFLRSEEVVFNPGGKGNRSREEVCQGGRMVPVFDPNERTAIPWTYVAALRYLVGEHLEWAVGDLGELDRWGGQEQVRELSVGGLSPLTALERVCEQAGLCYRVEDVPGPEEQVYAVLVFYRAGEGREIFLQHQPAGETLSMAGTNLVKVQLNTEGAGATIRAVGRGSVKRFESTFELVEGWDQSLEENDYDLYSPSMNEDFATYQQVFRKWVLNEAGDYSEAPYQQGEVYDLSKVFSTTIYERSRRRFEPGLSRTEQGEPISSASGALGYFLEVSYNSGASWQPYGGAFHILKEECGIYLSGDQLGPEVWVAICKGVLRFRITCSIEGDEPLEAVLSDGSVGSVRPVRTVLFNWADEFHFRRVTMGSIFAQVAGTGPGDEVDDTLRLRGRLREELRRLRRQTLAGKAELRLIRPDIQPGDIVRRIGGRQIDLERLAGPGEILPQVERVRMRFGTTWTTTIDFGG